MLPLPAPVAAELASVFIYAARSHDQRIEIVNGSFHARFYLDLNAPKQDNRRRSIEFIEKLKSKIFSSIGKHIWIRNFAAHGSVSLTKSQPQLEPGIFDFQSRIKISKRAGKTGLTANEIQKFATLLSEDSNDLMMLAMVTADFIQWYHVLPEKFLESANRLADKLTMPKLYLKDPMEGPPLRQRRPKQKRKATDRTT